MDYNYNDTTKSRKNKNLNSFERKTIEIRLKDGVEQIKNNKKVNIYCADAGARVYKENLQRSKKKFKYLECIDFINYVSGKFKREHWSIDGNIGHSKLNRLFPSNKMICTKHIITTSNLDY